MKLRFNKDVEFPFEDYDGSEHMIMTIKKGLEFEISDEDVITTEMHQYRKFGKAYIVDFEVYNYDRKYIDIKIIKESEECENDPEYYYNEVCTIEVHEDDVDII